MSYDNSLKDLLRIKDIDLFNRLPQIEKHAKDILQYTQAKFPYYTPHGFQHSENVLKNLNWLLSEEVKADFNAYELFFLIVAAWLHDWGLIGTPSEDSEEIRENHHIRTETKFRNHYSLIGVSSNEARIIGRICKGHRQVDLTKDEFSDTPFESGLIIHRRFLAAALRLADEVDVTASRVPEIIYYELNPVDQAEQEFHKQMNVLGIAYPSQKERYKLALSAEAQGSIAIDAITRLRDKIQTELDKIKPFLTTGINGVGMQIDFIYLQLDTQFGQTEQMEHRPSHSIEFRLDRNKVLELLIGQSLYPRKDVAIRELLQNAIDACKTKKALIGGYVPEITVHQVGDVISIEDNGIGMDLATAEQYLSLVGSSYYTSVDFKNSFSNKQYFDPISRWGLGFLSCFLLAKDVIIETKKNGSEGCKFSISGISSEWRYERLERSTSGTKISLHLTNEQNFLNIENIIRNYIKRSRNTDLSHK